MPNFFATVENLREVRHTITCFLHLFEPKEEVSGFHSGQSSYSQKLRRVFEVKNHQKSMLRGTLLSKWYSNYIITRVINQPTPNSFITDLRYVKPDQHTKFHFKRFRIQGTQGSKTVIFDLAKQPPILQCMQQFDRKRHADAIL